jgi:GPH family glycoside/pentoside/hexuronide:cation symporter
MATPLLPHSACARYGLLGLPLAFVAMPLYVMLPAHYGQTLGVPLGLLGAVLLGTRLADAFIDPALGRWADRLLAKPARAGQFMTGAALLLALGFAALFQPPALSTQALLAWCALTMALTFGAYSLASVLHLAWGTRLGGSVAQRARLVGWREGFGLLGVLLANVVATQAGLGWTTILLCGALALGVAALLSGPAVARPSTPEAIEPSSVGEALRAPKGAAVEPALHASQAELTAAAASTVFTAALPWRSAGFRRLISLFLVNGVASAVPATLVIFFIQDRLQAPTWTALYLGAYFAMAALSVPWWVRHVARIGLMPSWALGMALSLAAFVGVLQLQAGDTWAYLAVCLASGWALGADLTVPGTLLTGVVQRAGHAGQAEGAYAGWWQWATKLNLALAAGLALPALQWLDYTPGTQSPQGLLALTLVYGALPCAFKLIALCCCWRWRHHEALC